ncbi:YwdI family protein [Bacillus luteolus]|uniref:YwdI family protein n=1 Tax=Litchfieldia luteola TaxID=682179 RepID=A0ABR9QGS5_9BACI|nr:YwdI family protein [Cytobacillus luteolus]MBE4907703.1 YwdI family protein [Cytobacillus luteolus]MBP1944052.1 hypothetical protein [Cytobacillus luteolus]
MQIPLHKILTKMQTELDQAKQTNNEEKVKEHLVIIRTLCDLVIEEGNKIEQPQPTTPSIQQPITTAQATKLKEDDGNGDSIFDF